LASLRHLAPSEIMIDGEKEVLGSPLLQTDRGLRDPVLFRVFTKYILKEFEGGSSGCRCFL